MKKAFINMCFLAMPMYGVTLAIANIFIPVFLQISESQFLSYFTRWNYYSLMFIPNSFSISFLSILNPFTFILTLSFVPTNKLHLSALLFKRLFLNYSNKPLDACSRDVIRSSTLSEITYGVLPSA